MILRSKQFPFVIDERKHVNHKLPSEKADPATSTFLLNVWNRDFVQAAFITCSRWHFAVYTGTNSKVKGLTSA